MQRFTRTMLRHRFAVLGVWLAVFVAPGWASSQGEPFGLTAYDEIEGWIPVTVFALLLGRRGWWLPDGVARLVRVEPSPVDHAGAVLRPAGQ